MRIIGFLVCAMAFDLTGCSNSGKNTHTVTSSRNPSSVILKDDLSQAPFHVTLASTHEVRVLNDGMADLYKRLEMINRAQKSIYYETYLFKKDQVGRAILNALAKKARSGVQVNLLTDYYNDHRGPFFNSNDVAAFVNAKMNVRYYNPGKILFGYKFKKKDHRDHRKLLVIDGEELIIGGRNTANEYFGLSEEYNYQDRDIWVRGEVAKYAAETFESYWNNPIWVKTPKASEDVLKMQKSLAFINGEATGKPDEDSKYEKMLQTLKISGEAAWNSEKTYSVNGISLYTDKPEHDLTDQKDEKEEKVALSPDRIVTPYVHKAIGSINKSFLVENYSLAMSRTKEARFKAAILHDVNVRILTNGFPTTDSPAIAELSHLVEMGLVCTGEFKEGKRLNAFDLSGKAPVGILPEFFGDEFKNAKWALHSKSAVLVSTIKDEAGVDREVDSTWIGSYNYDTRSERINNEILIVVEDNRDVAGDVSRNINARINLGYELESSGRYSNNEPDMKSVLSLYQKFQVRVMRDLFDRTKENEKHKDGVKHCDYISRAARMTGIRVKLFGLY